MITGAVTINGIDNGAVSAYIGMNGYSFRFNFNHLFSFLLTFYAFPLPSSPSPLHTPVSPSVFASASPPHQSRRTERTSGAKLLASSHQYRQLAGPGDGERSKTSQFRRTKRSGTLSRYRPNDRRALPVPLG